MVLSIANTNDFYGFKYCYLIQIIQFNINYLFAHS